MTEKRNSDDVELEESIGKQSKDLVVSKRRYRTGLEIRIDILMVAVEPTRITHIFQKANLSYVLLRKHIKYLESVGLLDIKRAKIERKAFHASGTWGKRVGREVIQLQTTKLGIKAIELWVGLSEIRKREIELVKELAKIVEPRSGGSISNAV